MTDPVDSQFPESSGSAVGGAAALASTPDMAAVAPEGQGAGVARADGLAVCFRAIFLREGARRV